MPVENWVKDYNKGLISLVLLDKENIFLQYSVCEKGKDKNEELIHQEIKIMNYLLVHYSIMTLKKWKLNSLEETFKTY